MELATLRTLAAAATILAAARNARVTVSGFAVFIVPSIAWMIDGWLESKSSLLIQNAVLLLIDALSIWRWLPSAENEADQSSKAE